MCAFLIFEKSRPDYNSEFLKTQAAFSPTPLKQQSQLNLHSLDTSTLVAALHNFQ